MALQWGSVKYGWGDARIVALLCVFAVLFLGFLYVQCKSGNQATVSFRILKRRGILAGLFFAACVNGVLATTKYYISVYWQGVRGVSATKSGLLSASMIVGLMIASLVAGAGTNLIGYFTPFMLGTSLFAPIFYGLLTTIGGSQQTAQVAVYTGFLGFGVGLDLMGPIQAVSFLLHPSDVSIGAAVTGFGGTIGSAPFLSVSATLFQNRLGAEIMRYAPSTDLSRLGRAGLSNLRRVVVQGDLEALWKAYGKAVDQTLYLPLALSCATIIGSAFMEWPNVKKKGE